MAEQQTPSTFPCDDEIMKYDYSAHRYVLTVDGVLRELGIDLNSRLNADDDANPSTLAARLLSQVSRAVYNSIYKYSQDEAVMEYLLATYPLLRDRIKEMLQAQLVYVLINNDLGLFSGVNVAKGTAMDINALRGEARIAADVYDLMSRTIPGLSFPLNYVGTLPWVIPCGAYRQGY